MEWMEWMEDMDGREALAMRICNYRLAVGMLLAEASQINFIDKKAGL